MSKSGNTTDKFEIATRLRQIRLGSEMTQEKFAEVLEISVSAYKKIECAENQISVDGLRRLEKKLQISADYVLFGKHYGVDDAWKLIMNCSEPDKVHLLLRLANYFSEAAKDRYCIPEADEKYSLNILQNLVDTEQ